MALGMRYSLRGGCRLPPLPSGDDGDRFIAEKTKMTRKWAENRVEVSGIPFILAAWLAQSALESGSLPPKCLLHHLTPQRHWPSRSEAPSLSLPTLVKGVMSFPPTLMDGGLRKIMFVVMHQHGARQHRVNTQKLPTVKAGVDLQVTWLCPCISQVCSVNLPSVCATTFT